MFAFRFLLLSLVAGGFAALVYAIVRRTRDLETRQFDKDLGAWESEGGNLAPSRVLLAPNSMATQDTNKRQS
jgi:hypothetical protein